MKRLAPWVSTVMVALLLAVTPFSYAQEEEVEQAENPASTSITYEDVESIFKPVQNRLFVSLFGLEAMPSFIGDRASDAVLSNMLELSDEDLALRAAPFPSLTHKVIKVIMYSLYTMAFMFWVWLLSVFVFNKNFKKMAGGEDSSDSSPAFMMIRSAAVILLCLPIYSMLTLKEGDEEKPVYSLVHQQGFRVIGDSFHYAQRVDNIVKGETRYYNPFYAVPLPSYLYQKSTVKDFKSPLDVFAACIVMSGGSTAIKSSISTSDNDKLFVTFSSESETGYLPESCEYRVEITPDTVTPDQIDMLESSGIDIGVTSRRYTELEKQIFVDAATKQTQYYVAFMAAVYNRYSGGRKLEKSENIGGEPLNKVELNQWYLTCPANAPEILSGVGDNDEALASAFVKAKLCASMIYMKKTGYPSAQKSSDKTPIEFDKFRAVNGNSVVNVCSTDNNDGTMGGFDGLLSCSVDVCSSVDETAESPGLFACSLLIDNVYGDKLRGGLPDLGFMVSPAIYTDAYGKFSIPKDAQNILTTTTHQSNGFNPFDASSNNLTQSEKAMEEVFSMVNDAMHTATENDLEVTTLKGTQGMNTPSFDPFNVHRLTTCLSYSGYGENNLLCEPPTSEVKKFGETLIYYYLGSYVGSKAGFSGGDVKLAADKNTDMPTRGKMATFIGKWVGFNTVKNALVAGVTGAIIMDSSSEGSNSLPFGYKSGTDTYLDIVALSALRKVTNASDNPVNKAAALVQNQSMGPTVDVFKWMLVLGVFCAYIIPYAPVFIYYTALVAIVANLLVSMIGVTFHLIYVVSSVGGDIEAKSKKFIIKWVLILVRTPLIVTGFYLSMSLIETLIPELIKFAISFDLTATTSGLVAWLVSLVSIVFTAIGIVILYSIFLFMVFDTISSLFLMVRGMLFEDNSTEALGTVKSLSQVRDNMKYLA